MGCLGLEIILVGARLCFPLPDDGTGAPSAIVRCPPLKSYSAVVQARAADELRALPAGSELAGLIADYGTLRKKCRAIESN